MEKQVTVINLEFSLFCRELTVVVSNFLEGISNLTIIITTKWYAYGILSFNATGNKQLHLHL